MKFFFGYILLLLSFTSMSFGQNRENFNDRSRMFTIKKRSVVTQEFANKFSNKPANKSAKWDGEIGKFLPSPDLPSIVAISE